MGDEAQTETQTEETTADQSPPDGSLLTPGAGEPESDKGSTETPAWMKQLPDTLKENDVLKNYKSIGDVGTKFLELNEKAGKIKPPPENPDGYKFPDPVLPDGMEIDSKFLEKYKHIAHAAGLTEEQATALYKVYNDYAINQFETVKNNRIKQMNASAAKLKESWGAEYEANMLKAQAVIAKYGTKEDVDELYESGKGNDPLLVRIVHALSKDIVEPEFNGGSRKLGPGKKSGDSIDDYNWDY